MTARKYTVPAAPDRPLWDIWLSMHALPALTVGIEIGLFESLAEGPASSDELAERLALNRHALRGVARMLASLGILHHREGRFRLTRTASTYLVASSELFFGPVLRVGGQSPRHDALVGALKERPDPDKERHVDHWESGEVDPDTARIIAKIMHAHSRPASAALARLPVWSTVDKVLDVGGGSGCFSIALAQAYPALRCTVLELGGMTEVARGYIDEGGVPDRVDTRVVDMFRDDWPDGYDGILLSNILHDWSLEACAELARRAFAALPSGGRIFVHEMLLDDDGCGPATTASFSLLMLTGTRGQQLTLPELRQLLESAGFLDVDAVDSYGYYSLVTARKP